MPQMPPDAFPAYDRGSSIVGSAQERTLVQAQLWAALEAMLKLCGGMPGTADLRVLCELAAEILKGDAAPPPRS